MSDIEKNNNEIDLQISPTLSTDNIDTDQIIGHIKSSNGDVIGITGDVDEAMKYAIDSEDVELSDEDAKKLLRKVDFCLLPLICFLYALQFMDKVSSSYAAIMGLRQHFNMVGDQYSWVGSSFYLGYLIFEFPVSMVLQRFPVAKTTAVFVIVWGVILALHATPSTYAGFITLRTLLGIFESAVTPAMVIITGQWYKADEQFIRTAIWFACNGLGTIMGSGIAYGLAIRQGSYSMATWKVLFVVVGCMTIAVGFMVLVHIPDIPVKAWFLTDKEKKQIVLRIKSNNQGFGNRHFKWYQFKEAILDINTWIFFFFAIAIDIPNGALTNFGAILLQDSFGYSATKSLLMNMPGGAVQIVGCNLLAYSQKYFRHKLAVSTFTLCVTIATSSMLAFATNDEVRLAGYYLFYISPVAMICCLSCFTSNVAGHTKKITVNAFFLIGYCVGNLIGPQTFIAAQAPKYRGGQISIVVSYSASVVLNLWLYYNYWSENKRRDQLAEKGELEVPQIQNIEFADLTDKENLTFRYKL